MRTIAVALLVIGFAIAFATADRPYNQRGAPVNPEPFVRHGALPLLRL